MMKAAQIRREKCFRKLGKGLKNDWEEVATHCGIPHEKIENIRASTCNPHLHEKSFQFLVKLWEQFPHLEDWSEKLLQALKTAERIDLVEQLREFRLKEKTIQDTMDEGSLDSLTSSSSQKGLPGDSSVPENSKRSENEGILKTASQNGNAKPEGSAATKMSSKSKRKLSKDSKENSAEPHSSPKIKKRKTLKIVPVEPPPGELKLIKDINQQRSPKWYTEAWLDGWATAESDIGPVKSKRRRLFYSHCFLRDKSEEKIFTTIFCKFKKDCMHFRRMLNGSSEEKRLYLHLLDVEKVKAEFLDKPGQSNYGLILNKHSKVTKAFEEMKVDK